jgi:RNA polymerase sigma-70 factor, ECF subfamily
MYTNSTDENLLAAIKSGDEGAFQFLFEKHYKSLCYAAYKVYPDEHKSKDFAQEVFLTLWRKRNKVEIHTSLQAFLRRAVVNKAIDYIRAQRLNFEEVPDTAEEQMGNNEGVEFNEMKDLIHHTATQLPERCRMVFFLSRFEELSHKEIAARLDISEKTVENQITKALKLMRKALSDYRPTTGMLLLFFSLIS